MDNRDGYISKLGTTFILGAIAGWIIGMLMPQEVREKNSEEIKAKANSLKKILTDPNEQERIRSIFNEKTDQVSRRYQNIKQTLVDKLSSFKGGIEDIDKQKYSTAVQETMDKIKNSMDLTDDQLQKIQDYFEEDYSLIERRMKKPNEQ